jgi:hypothetical protein
MPWFANLRYDFFISPSWESPDLGIALLARCEQRSQQIPSKVQEAPPKHVTCYIAHTNARDRLSLEVTGFKLLKYHFQMQINLQETPLAPRWPAGIQMRTGVAGQYQRQVHNLIEAAFDHPGRIPSQFNDWSNAMLRADIFDPSLWFLAFKGEELVGACLCAEEVTDPAVRLQAMSIAASSVVIESYVLFEFQVGHVLVVEYDEEKKSVVRRWNREN